MNTNISIDRRGLFIAMVVGLAYVVLGAPPILAIGAGALVYALNLAFARPSWHEVARLPVPTHGTPEAAWLERAEIAAGSIAQLRSSARTETIAERCSAIALRAELTIRVLRRLCYQAGVLSHITQVGTSEPLAPLTNSGRARRETTDRLEATRREVYGRIETYALALEATVARLAEVVALEDDAAQGTPIDLLAQELDALPGGVIGGEDVGFKTFPVASQQGKEDDSDVSATH